VAESVTFLGYQVAIFSHAEKTFGDEGGV